MKRLFVGIMCLMLFVGSAMPTLAQTSRNRKVVRSKVVRTQQQQQYGRRAYDRRYDNRSVWDKHRDVITVAGGTGAGAIIGGLAGGKKGAAIGALLGAGGSALYTYKVRDRDEDRRYRR